MLYDCDDGVLLVRRGAVMTQMRPYKHHSKECGEGCRCYMIATTAYYCYVENIHNAAAVLYALYQSRSLRIRNASSKIRFATSTLGICSSSHTSPLA